MEMDVSLSQSKRPPVALLGFCIPAMEALDELGRDFIAVVPDAFEAYMQEHDIKYELWDFNRRNDQSSQLAGRLAERGVTVAVPLFEETVEWAGSLNSVFRDDPRLFTRYLLFRDKAMMKRRAQMHGIRVGVFEEAEDRDDAYRFLKRVQTVMVAPEEDLEDPVHLKPLNAAGCLGHRVLRSQRDVDALTDDDFPSLLETHLDGQEFSVEAFIHRGEVRFLNITEYVHLGHSNFVPASETLEARRPVILKAVQDLVRAFDIEYGMIHPEYFITPDNRINFGEVAARVPGGHIFELIHRSYGFNPFAAFVLCADPATTDEELEAFFPDPREHDGYSGCLMVYPKRKVVTRLDIPDELLHDDYYEKHNLFVPANPKVAERVAFGDHYGTIFFRGDDSDAMEQRLRDYEAVDFYAADEPVATASSE